jgi:Spy/CpxP family protein refolding chaperone
MKHTTLLSLAGIIGAAALVISHLDAAEPNPTSSPPESPTAKASPPSGDSQKFCGSDQLGGARERFHGSGRHWARHRDHGGDGQMLDRLLNLTDEQKEKVKEIMEASRPKIKAIREEQRAKMQAVRDEARKQIRPLLTPAQQKVFDDAQKLREDARKLREEARNLRQENEGNRSE